jgi:hypothetical protein
MASTKNKNKTPQLTRRAALTTPSGVFSAMENSASGFWAVQAVSRRVVASI